MRSFIATNGNQIYTSGYAQCLSWALHLDSNLPTVIHTARGSDKSAKVIAEVTEDGAIRYINDGRLIKIRKLIP